MSDDTMHRARPGFGYVRTLSQQEELPLLRDHLLRLDRDSRHDRFNGYLEDEFVERYAARCADDGTVIIAYMENGIVRGAAELHPPGQSDDGVPEIAFSVETCVRRQGVGSILFKRLLSEARWKGYRRLRVTTVQWSLSVSTSRSSRCPAAWSGRSRATPSVDAWARWAAPNASLTYTSANDASERAKPGSFLVSPGS